MATLRSKTRRHRTETVDPPSPMAQTVTFRALSPTQLLALAIACSGPPICLRDEVSPLSRGTKPTGAITPNGESVYVAVEGTNSVIPISTSTATTGTPISVGDEPVSIAISPKGTTAYAASLGNSTVNPITLATGVVGKPIAVATEPVGLAFTPDGSMVYVTSSPEPPSLLYRRHRRLHERPPRPLVVGRKPCLSPAIDRPDNGFKDPNVVITGSVRAQPGRSRSGGTSRPDVGVTSG